MLYIVMLGGRHPRASIEVHDVLFAQAETLADTYPQLRANWFGSPKGLHIDAWMEVDGVDAYRIEFSQASPAPGALRLFFLNLGGYEPGVFGEAHRYLLIAAPDKATAKRLGRHRMAKGWIKAHTDAVLDIDDCLPIDLVGGRYVHLVEGEHCGIVQRSDYLPI